MIKEINCIKCNNKIHTTNIKHLDIPRLCKTCKQIEIFEECVVCGKSVKVKNLIKYFTDTNNYRQYCSHGCCMKDIHNQNDGLKYCEKCGTNTKHMIGIGCMTCFNKDESHKQSIINTVKERYGEEYTNVYQVPEIKDKIIEVSLKKYGTTNPGNSREARIKANKTMRGNGNGSSCEDYFEEALNRLGIIYEKQYKDERYPFLCDFYLPNSDTFIELNIYWSHNDHWYDSENEDDVKLLKEWIKKAEAGHKQYENAVAVWSDKDLKKREYAIKNRLNYVVLWTIEDIDRYIREIPLSDTRMTSDEFSSNI